MSKWTRYRKVELVDVMLFEHPVDPANPPYPIKIDPCSCEPQDGYTCPQHRAQPTYSYHYRAPDRFVSIRPGEYLIRFADGRAITALPSELFEHYETGNDEL